MTKFNYSSFQIKDELVKLKINRKWFQIVNDLWSYDK